MDSVIEEYNRFLTATFDKYSLVNHMPSIPFWIIRGGPHWGEPAYDEKRKAFLEKLFSDFPGSVFNNYDLERPTYLKGDWIEASKSKWIIPKDVDIKEFYDFIYQGDCNMHKTVKEPIPYWGKYKVNKPSDFMKAIIDIPLVYLLEVESDNDPWLFGINPRVPPTDETRLAR